MNGRSPGNFSQTVWMTFHCRGITFSVSAMSPPRHRTVRTKGALSQKTARLMVYKLVHAHAKGWRRLKGANQLPMVIQGIKFTDGVVDAANRAA